MIGQGLRPPSVEGVYLGLGEGGGEGGFDFVQQKYHISSSDPRDLLTIKNQVRDRSPVSEIIVQWHSFGAGSLSELLFKLSGGLMLALNELIIQVACTGKYPFLLCP